MPERHEHDAQEVKEILEVVSTEIPKLIEAISTTMYSKEKAEDFAKSVAAFYKQMKDSGMDDAQAYDLTQKFMANFSIGGMIGQVFKGGISRRGPVDEEVNEAIKKRIRKELDDDDE